MIIWTPRIRKILVISTSIKRSLDQLFSALIHENLAVGMTIDRRCSFRSSKLQSIHQNDYYNYALAQVRPLFSRRQRKHWRSLPTDEHHAFERRQLVSRKQRHRLTVVIAMTICFPSSFLRTSGDRKQACLSISVIFVDAVPADLESYSRSQRHRRLAEINIKHIRPR